MDKIKTGKNEFIDPNDLPNPIYPKNHMFVDITGEMFGRSIALYPCARDGSGRILWLALCECGNFFAVQGKSLRNRNTKSCGCLQKDIASKISLDRNNAHPKDMIGKKFSFLTVKSFNSIQTTNYGKKRYYYNCECECGQAAVVAGTYLRTGETKSCGCVKSLGESKIKNILKENGIRFETEFAVRIDGSDRRFDFKIYDSRGYYYLEYDGEQHYNERFFSKFYDDPKERLKETQNADIIKNNYCFRNNIDLIRIPYTKYSNLNLEDLKRTSKFIVKEGWSHEKI